MCINYICVTESECCDRAEQKVNAQAADHS